MTTKDAILGLAAKISESAVTNVATDAQALAELAKAMCGSAPTEPIATVDDAIAYITENYSGGGGDVSTATVTYTLTGGKSDITVEAAIAVEDESGKYSGSSFFSEETSGTFTVLLYDDRALATFIASTITVVSGDAEVFDSGALGITGDCIVTVAPD